MPLVFIAPTKSGSSVNVMNGSNVETKFVAMKFMSYSRSPSSR